VAEFFVIIPAFNAAATLPHCLPALEEQTIARDHYEIILIDDGSTDRTAEIAGRFRLQYRYQENQGPAAARNHGVELAAELAADQTDSLIFFTDADCVPDPDWLEQMAAPFADNPEVAAVKGAYRTEQQSVIARFSQLEFEERFELLARQDSIDMVDTYSAGFRMAVFRGLGGFDRRFPVANNEDTELSYRMAAQGLRMVFTPRAVVRHLNHPDSVPRYFRLKYSRGFWRMMVYRMFPNKMVRDSYTPQSLKLQIIGLFLMTVSLILLFLVPKTGFLCLAGSLLFFLGQTVAFTRSAFQQDRLVGLLSPLLLALRAAAIGSGALRAVIALLLQPDLFAGGRGQTK
jgi:GT2 family glycosyltransferase